MKQICTGTLITLLYQARAKSGDYPRVICDGVFKAFQCDLSLFSKTLPSHLKSGKEGAPKVLYDAAMNLSEDEVNDGIKKYVIPLIAATKHEALFRAIRAVLREDRQVQKAPTIGYEGFNFHTIIDNNTFEESALLAAVLRHAIVNTQGSGMQNVVRELPDDFVDSLIDSSEAIYFELPQNDEVTPLKRTIKDTAFKRIFHPATTCCIEALANRSTINIYYVEPINCKFRFSQLKDFLINHIGDYVTSRGEAQRLFERTKDRAAVGTRAMVSFLQAYGQSSESVLGELLLYVFLEQELDAPKIMTKIELHNSAYGQGSKSDGIHLLTIPGSVEPLYQLVFGASDIQGNLYRAIDRAFDKIAATEAAYDQEYKMVYNTSQSMIYDDKSIQFMRELMMPQRNGSYRPDMAFGAFLGYTVKLDKPEENSERYRTAIIEQLKTDVAKAEAYVCNKIKTIGLGGHSFYFFVFPFNDADDERTSIISEMLKGGF